MRMRKKKHLEERLAQGAQNNVFVYRSDNLKFTDTDVKDYIDLDGYFGRKAPLHMEVGCGKGGFMLQLAAQNPHINYIAVEYCANVIVTAAEAALKAGLKNVLFVNADAGYLQRLIPENSIELIYLNFSCPFPKKKYASHRLTNARFLNIYRSLMTENAAIYQKTDNRPFFDYSIEQFEECGFKLSNVTFDLANSGFEGNIMTEYERRFTSMGVPICRLEAR